MPEAKTARRQPLNSVSTKLIFFVFVSTFLTALVVSWISIQSTHSYLRRQLDLALPHLLDDGSLALQRWLSEGVASLDGISHQPIASAETLADWLAVTPQFSAAAVGGADAVRSSAGNWELPAERVANLVATRPEPSLTPVRGADERSWLIASAPAGANLRVFALVDPVALSRLIPLDPERRELSIHLLDQTGGVVGAAGPDLPAWTPPTQLLDLRPGAVHEISNPSGERILGSRLGLVGLPLQLVATASFDVAFQPVLDVVTRIFAIDLFIILVFSSLAYKITATILKPIEALSDGARRISRGELDTEIPVPRSGDEIALLTRTFNDMVRKLQRTQDEIQNANQRLVQQNEELQSANEVLSQLSITDGLTKLHNHRYFQDYMTRELKRVSRSGEALSILLIDLDDFKALNDRYGHAAGDEVLVRISQIMNDNVRESDLLARYGGEEFVVLATATDLAGAVAQAENLRLAVDRSKHIIDDSLRPVRLSVSIGVAQFRGDRKACFRAADDALYRAKGAGKNCVVAESVDDDDDPAPARA